MAEGVIDIFIGLTFLLLALLVAVGTPLVLRYLENRSVKNREKGTEEKKAAAKKNRLDLKTLLEIQDIRDGHVVLTNNRQCSILKLNPINFNLMAQEEQTAVENSLISLNMSQDCTVQYFVTTKAIDVNKPLQTIARALENDNSEIRQNYGLELAAYLQGIMDQKVTLVRQAYAIITTSEEEEEEESSVNKLAFYTTVVANGLSRAHIMSSQLSSEEIADLISGVTNRHLLFKPSQAVKKGAFELYVSHIPITGQI